eukprot:2491435-Karenia_brevis.AAC.1
MAKQRGPLSIRVTKVKGHATNAEVQGNAELLRLKKGNDTADKIATNTYDTTHGSHITQISQIYHSRYNNY